MSSGPAAGEAGDQVGTAGSNGQRAAPPTTARASRDGAAGRGAVASRLLIDNLGGSVRCGREGRLEPSGPLPAVRPGRPARGLLPPGLRCPGARPRFHIPESGRAWMEDERFTSEYRTLTGGGQMEMADKKLLLRNLATWSRDVEGHVASAVRSAASRPVSSPKRRATPGRCSICSTRSKGCRRPGAATANTGTRAPWRQVRRTVSGLWVPHANRAVVHRRWIPERFPDFAVSGFVRPRRRRPVRASP